MVDSRTPDGFLQRVEVVRTHSSTALTNALQYERPVPPARVAVLGKGNALVPRPNAAENTGHIGGRHRRHRISLLLSGRLQARRRSQAAAQDSQKRLRTSRGPHQEGERRTRRACHKGRRAAGAGEPRSRQGKSEAVRGPTAKGRGQAFPRPENSIATKSSPKPTKAKRKAKSRSSRKASRASKSSSTRSTSKKRCCKIRSPIDGRVVTSNVQERLRVEPPVNRGENLLEIADPDKEWELEVLMPEKRMGHIAEARVENQRQTTGNILPRHQPGRSAARRGRNRRIERRGPRRIGKHGPGPRVVRSRQAAQGRRQAKNRRERHGKNPLRQASDRLRMVPRSGGFHPCQNPVPNF